ncbi:MAG: hypothetical protein VX254_10170, partial [Planctomycetota bacterium]|nr:hypothetical protein [Planctomycetota bacterium]
LAQMLKNARLANPIGSAAKQHIARLALCLLARAFSRRLLPSLLRSFPGILVCHRILVGWFRPPLHPPNGLKLFACYRLRKKDFFEKSL